MFKSSIGKTIGFLSLLLALSPLILKAYTITGNVKDVHEGNNIENAEVIVQDYNDSTRIDTAYTDANGDFSLEWSFDGGISEEEAKEIQISVDGNILKVSEDINNTIKGNVFNTAGMKVGELEKGIFSASNIRQGNYFMILESDGEMIAQVKFQNLNNNVSSVSPKWNIEKNDNVSSTSTYKKETNYSSEKANSSSLRSSKLDSLEFTFNHSDIWERVTYRIANPDETNNYDFSVIDKSIFDSTMMDFYNEITRRTDLQNGTKRWASGKTIQYMVDTTDMLQPMINTIVSIINDEVIYITDNKITPVINFTNTHPDHYYGADTINVHIDKNIPGQGEHSETSVSDYDGNDYTLETAYAKLKRNEVSRGVVLQEILQTLGWVCDSDMENSVFNEGAPNDYLQKADSLSRILYMRPPRTQDPDKDPEGVYLNTSMNSSNPENIEFCYNNSGLYKTEEEKEMFFNYGGETIKFKEDEITKVKLNDLIKK